MQTHATIRDQQTIPFLMLPKAYFKKNLSWRATLCFVALKYYAAREGRSCERVPLKAMAKLIGVGETTFKHGVKELQKAGIVKVKSRSRKSTKGEKIPLPNLYELADLNESL